MLFLPNVVCYLHKRRQLGVLPEGGYVGCGDAVNQEIQLRDGEHALLLVEDQAVVDEDGEQHAAGRSVLLSGFAEDPVIIFLCLSAALSVAHEQKFGSSHPDLLT